MDTLSRGSSHVFENIAMSSIKTVAICENGAKILLMRLWNVTGLFHKAKRQKAGLEVPEWDCKSTFDYLHLEDFANILC